MHEHSAPHAEPHTATPRRAQRRIAIALILLVIAVPAGWLALRAWNVARDRQLAAALAADSAETRKRAAWRAAEGDRPITLECAAEILEQSVEPDPDVREALAYSLGRAGRPEHFHVLALTAETDDNGRVRYAACVGAARVSAERFRVWAEARAAQNPWEQIALAQAWLEVGHPRGVDDLLGLMLSADAQVAGLARDAVQRRVAPLLEAVGLWAVGAPPPAEWDAAFADDLRARIAAAQLHGVLQHVEMHAQPAGALRRNVGRILGGRERLARLLLGR